MILAITIIVAFLALLFLTLEETPHEKGDEKVLPKERK